MYTNGSCSTECEGARQPDGLKNMEHGDRKETRLSAEGLLRVLQQPVHQRLCNSATPSSAG